MARSFMIFPPRWMSTTSLLSYMRIFPGESPTDSQDLPMVRSGLDPADFFHQPGPAEGPQPVRGPFGDAKDVGGLARSQSGEIAELDQLGRLLVGLRELFEGFVQCQNVFG